MRWDYRFSGLGRTRSPVERMSPQTLVFRLQCVKAGKDKALSDKESLVSQGLEQCVVVMGRIELPTYGL